MEDFNQQINNFLDPILNTPLARVALSLLIILYGALAAPILPDQIKSYMDNAIVRLLFFALIIWTGNHDPVLAIMTALGFIVTINVASSKKPFDFTWEKFEGPATAIYPGCMNITVFDLLESFKNDKEALMNAMMVSKVPADIKITDYYAPLIATYLLNKGFTLKAPCTPPGVDQQTTA